MAATGAGRRRLADGAGLRRQWEMTKRSQSGVNPQQPGAAEEQSHCGCRAGLKRGRVEKRTGGSGTKPIGREWRNEANRSSRRVCQRGCITGGRGPGARGRGPERSARGELRNEANLCVAARKARCEGLAGSEDRGTKPIGRGWRNEANRSCRRVGQQGCITVSSVARGEWGFQVSG